LDARRQSGLTLIAANDDDGSPGGTSSVTFPAQSGTNYKIAVDGKNGASGNYLVTVKYVSADLSLSINAVEASLTSVRYDLTVTNAGPLNATNVKVNVTLPAGATLDQTQAGGCTATGTNVVTCLFGTINAPGGSVSTTFYATVSGAGNYSATATVSSDQIDPNPGNNVVTVQAAVVADVPTLPEWGMILLACLLLASTEIQTLRRFIRRG
jgi:hypothetical protein